LSIVPSARTFVACVIRCKTVDMAGLPVIRWE
jgi:hypothetical protein